MSSKRLSGILLHPTSLPGPHGSGNFGEAARHFIDWLAAGAQTLWQILPLSGIGPGNSPYMSPSAFAGNELLIDLTQLHHSGWLRAEDIAPESALRDERVDYSAVIPYRMRRLRLAAERFFSETHGHEEAHQDFAAFCAEAQSWLDDYALFMALDQQYGGEGKLWQDWPATLALRDPDALQEAAQTLAGECDFWKFCQWCFDRQWHAIKQYANERGIRIIGDMPIFVSAHSADVWMHQALFDLGADGRPRVIAGVPPDYFSATGQRWGNPLYRWNIHAQNGYRWWIARIRRVLSLCDGVRIDHFRGFESYWEIPADAEMAVHGHWQPGPGLALFDAIRQAGLFDEMNSADGGTPKIFAEDLGILTPEVVALRRTVGLPGMRILQFAFDGQSDNLYLPHNFTPDTVVYTGTHDNDTSLGWWNALGTHQQDDVRRYLDTDGSAIHWALIRAAAASVATISIVPMQDVLGLDTHSRMNRPGQSHGNWEWRFQWRQVEPWHAGRLAELAHLYGRHPDAPQPAFA